MPFFSSLLSILGTFLVQAPFVQIQPSLRPSKSGLFRHVSSMYSSFSACVTTIISTSTTSHSLLPPYPTCFTRGLFGTGLRLNSLHSTGYARLWSHLPSSAYLPLFFLSSYVQTPLTPMLALFWSRLSCLLHFLAPNCRLQNIITLSQIVSSWPYFWPASGGVAFYMGRCPR